MIGSYTICKSSARVGETRRDWALTVNVGFLRTEQTRVVKGASAGEIGRVLQAQRGGAEVFAAEVEGHGDGIGMIRHGTATAGRRVERGPMSIELSVGSPRFPFDFQMPRVALRIEPVGLRRAAKGSGVPGEPAKGLDPSARAIDDGCMRFPAPPKLARHGKPPPSHAPPPTPAGLACSLSTPSMPREIGDRERKVLQGASLASGTLANQTS